MAKNKKDSVELLLSKLDKEQLVDFIRKECAYDVQVQDRFLALGVGILFEVNPETYTSRVKELIDYYEGRQGYIECRDTFDFNRAVTKILEEADVAIRDCQWDVAAAVLLGVAAASHDILNSGDDSAGEMESIVSDCFYKLHALCHEESLPADIKKQIFGIALQHFDEKKLRDWSWLWTWMEIAISLADTSEKQNQVIKSIDSIKPDIDNWNARKAQMYKLKVLSKHCTPAEQRQFMYDNIANPDFRRNLLKIAWDEENYDEVLRLANDGIAQDAQWPGLISDWHKWKYQVYCKIGDTEGMLRLARRFFFQGVGWGDYSMDNMYSKMKSLVAADNWNEYVKTLVTEATQSVRGDSLLLFIYTQEKLWGRYMDYIRENCTIRQIDEAPIEVKRLYKDKIVRLYSTEVRKYFKRASSRSQYRQGVELLRKLINYGGEQEAERIVAEQKARTPRRPALVDELSKLK